MNGYELVQHLKNGNRIYGTAILSNSALWPSAVKSTGIDFVFLDTEHVPLGRETLAQMCQVYKSLGLPPLVRIPSPDPFQACMALDGGAVGILAPYIESVEQVKALVGATKLRPLKGNKLTSLLADRSKMNEVLGRYITDRNKNNILLINIESLTAVENLDHLLAVPGLDGIIIGPHDLSCSLDIPEAYQNPLFKKTVRTIIEKSRMRGLPVGIHLSEAPELQIEWGEAGANIILHSSDISLFGTLLKKDIAQIRQALGDDRETSAQRKTII